MSRLKIKSRDVLKWGFFGQIGRNLGRDVYNGAKKGLKELENIYIDKSNVKESDLGKINDDGHFIYNYFSKTSTIEYVFYTIGLLILPFIYAPILLYKSLKRIFRGKIVFTNIYNCPIYRKDGQGNLSKSPIGYTPIEFSYTKSYQDALCGRQIDWKKSNPVAKTIFDNIMYLILALAGFYWMFFIHNSISSIRKTELAEKMQTTEIVTSWTDSVIYDSFSEKKTHLKYLYPTIDGVLQTELVLVKQDSCLDMYMDYFSFSYDEQIDIKTYKNGEYKILMHNLSFQNAESLLDNDALHIVLNGFGEKEYGRKTSIKGELKKSILTCDSLFIRNKDKVYKFVCL